MQFVQWMDATQNCCKHRLDACHSSDLYMRCHCPLLVIILYYTYSVVNYRQSKGLLVKN